MIDLFILLIFIFMICWGLYRGFIKEILSFCGLVASIMLSIACNKWIIENFINYDNDRFLSSTIAYVLSFLFFSILFSALFFLILKIFKKEESSVSDRLLGGLIGATKAYLLCLLFYFIVYGFNATLRPELNEKDDIRQIEIITPEWLKDSKTYSFFYNSVLKLDDLLRMFLNEKKEVISVNTSEKKEAKNELEKKHEEGIIKEEDHHEENNHKGYINEEGSGD